MEALANRFGGEVSFLFVYGDEYHPARTDLVYPGENNELHPLPALDQVRNYPERVERAREFRRRMGGSVRRFLVDEEAQRVQLLYGATFIARTVVVDRHGHVVLDRAGIAAPHLQKCLEDMLAVPPQEEPKHR